MNECGGVSADYFRMQELESCVDFVFILLNVLHNLFLSVTWK